MRAGANIAAALKALALNKSRSGLTLLGVMVGVAALETMVAVGDGAENQVSERIRSLGANLLLVQPGSVTTRGAQLGAGSQPTLTEADAAAIAAEVPGAVAVAPGVAEKMQVVRGNANWSTIVTGVTPAFHTAREWPVLAGRAISEEDLRVAAKAAVVGQTVVERLFGAEPALDQTLRIGVVPFTVVGVLDQKGESTGGNDQDDVVLVPLSTAKQRLFGSEHADRRAVEYIVVKAETETAMAAVERETRELLRQRHRLRYDEDDDFRIRNLAEVMAARRASTRVLSVMLAAVASVSLIVGGISIMNIMLVSVTERTREIGLRMAVGARRRDILSQFVTEAVTLSLVGGVIGVIIGTVGAAAIAQLAGWPVLLRPGAILLAICFAGAVGVFFGYYPALKASRLDPIRALRFE